MVPTVAGRRVFDKAGWDWFKLLMNREALLSLDKETPVRLVLAQAESIAVLTRQVEVLTARVAELEAKPGLPPETPGNFDMPPSRG